MFVSKRLHDSTSTKLTFRACLALLCAALIACDGSAVKRDAEEKIYAARVTEARTHRCDLPGNFVTQRPTVRASNKWISLLLPADATGPFYESDDFYATRPKWSGHNWKAHVVINGANLVEFAEDSRLCNVSDAAIERNVFVGRWIDTDGVFSVLARQGKTAETDRHVILSVSIEAGGLSEAEALQIVASAQVDWEAHYDN